MLNMAQAQAQNLRRDDYLSWDDTFMLMSTLVAQRSKDPNTQVGACIVDHKNRIIGIGYNGFPRGCDDDKFPWARDNENPLLNKYYYVIHAEQNAINNSNQLDLDGCSMYITHHPCHECVKQIIQSGIKKVYYNQDINLPPESIEAACTMLAAAGVDLIYYSSPRSMHLALKA